MAYSVRAPGDTRVLILSSTKKEDSNPRTAQKCREKARIGRSETIRGCLADQSESGTMAQVIGMEIRGNELGRVVDPEELERADGPVGRLNIDVLEDWLAEGAEVEV